MANTQSGLPPPSPGAGEYLERALAWSAEVRQQVECHIDVPYGPDERHKLDLYLPGAPATGAGPLPVLLFFHGGYWVIGHKDTLGFMALGITPAPAILVTAGYRLAPGAKYPQQVNDCRNALRWVYENVADYGGDPDRIFVGGHSAGGHLAALIALQPDQLAHFNLPFDVVKGCLPVSGVFDVTDAPPERQEAFLASPDDAVVASPLHNTKGNNLPFFLEIGEDDFPNLRAQHAAMAGKLRQETGIVEEMERLGHNHFAISLDHGNPESPWTKRARAWLRGDTPSES